MTYIYPSSPIFINFAPISYLLKDLAAVKNITCDYPSVAPYKCDNCDFKGKSRSNLETHREKIHRNNSAILASTTREIVSKPSKFVIHPPLNVLPSTPVTLYCEICKSTFYKEEYLKEHLKSIYEGTDNPTSSFPMCDQSSPDILNTLSHDDPIPLTLPCDLCGTVFPSELKLNEHVKLAHEVLCNSCNTTFYDSFDLAVHQQSEHPKSQPTNIPCFLCGKAFNDPAIATKHIQSNHEIKCNRIGSFMINMISTFTN